MLTTGSSLDSALLEGASRHACFARRHRPAAFNAYCFVAKRDALLDGPADDVTADGGRSAVDGALADVQLLLGERDDLLCRAASYSRRAGRLGSGICCCAGLVGFGGAARLFVDIVRPMLGQNGLGLAYRQSGFAFFEELE